MRPEVLPLLDPRTVGEIAVPHLTARFVDDLDGPALFDAEHGRRVRQLGPSRRGGRFRIVTARPEEHGREDHRGARPGNSTSHHDQPPLARRAIALGLHTRPRACVPPGPDVTSSCGPVVMRDH